MIVKNLKANNVGILSDIDIEFQKGINVFVGDIGQGKSTILKPLALGIINQVEKGTTMKELIQWNKDSANFSFEFEHNDLYQLEMELTKSGSTRNLTVNNHDTMKNSDVVNHLATKFDPSLTKAAMVSLQSDSTDIVNSTDAERRERFKKIYDLDLTEQAKEVEALRKEFELELEETNKKILILEHKEYAYSNIQELPFTEAELEKKKIEIDKLNNQKTKLEIERDKIEEKKKAISDLEKDINRLESEEKEYQETIAKKEQAIIDANTKLTDIESRKAQLSESKENKKQSLTEQKQEIEAKIAEIKPVRLARFDDSELKKLRTEVADYKASIRSLEKGIAACAEGVCASCHQTVDESHKTNLEKDLQEAKGSLLESETLLKEQEEKQEAYDQKKEQKQENDRKKDKLESELTAKSKEIESLDTEYTLKFENLEADIVRYTEAIPTYKAEQKTAQEKLEDLQKRLIELKESLQEKNTEIESFDKEDSISKLATKIQNIQKQVDNYNFIVTDNARIEKENAEIEEQEEKDKATLQNLKVEKNTIQGQIEKLKYGETIFKKELPNYILSSLISEVEEGMNEFLIDVYGGRYEAFLSEKKDGIALSYGPAKAGIKNASGAEKDLFNIGLKYAFSKMAGIKSLWLDEVDKFMSTDQAEKVFAYIYQKVVDGELDQVFIISHNDEIKAMLENTFEAKIFYIEKGKVA